MYVKTLVDHCRDQEQCVLVRLESHQARHLLEDTHVHVHLRLGHSPANTNRFSKYVERPAIDEIGPATLLAITV